MDPILATRATTNVDHCEIISMAWSRTVQVVTAIAAVTFAISTYCILTYGAPLAAVAFVANPLLSASIACTLAIISIYAGLSYSIHRKI
ncbi:MAG: hypothetical protein H0T62_05225 [Parachlamydiaceae bacterium]|nr:hypothetical protein [Parachlamydiaceae bacterium]